MWCRYGKEGLPRYQGTKHHPKAHREIKTTTSQQHLHATTTSASPQCCCHGPQAEVTVTLLCLTACGTRAFGYLHTYTESPRPPRPPPPPRPPRPPPPVSPPSTKASSEACSGASRPNRALRPDPLGACKGRRDGRETGETAQDMSSVTL